MTEPIKRLPFCPMPVPQFLALLEKNKHMTNVGKFIEKQMPTLQVKMEQSRLGLEAWQYAAISFFSSLFFSLIVFSLIAIIGSIKMPDKALLYSLIFGGVIWVAIIGYSQLFPTMIILKRMRELEKGTLFALRHMLIRLRAGVSLFDAMASIAKGGYGAVSDEFENTVRKMGAGTDQAKAMDEMAYNNPSPYFRRAIWQISNAMKTGADITDVLEHLVESLSFDQRIKIKEAGASMNPIALMYMMFTVILPSMGIVFLISLSMFMGLELPDTVFYAILGMLTFFQYNFIGIIKSRRPSVEL